MSKNAILNSFQSDISNFKEPLLFDYPMYYQPHNLAVIAAKELQQKIASNCNLMTHLGLGDESSIQAVGKMFGVLVVKDKNGRIKYITGFSGQLPQEFHSSFVPPICEEFDTRGYFYEQTQVLNKANISLNELLKDPQYLKLIENLERVKKERLTALQSEKKLMKETKAVRKENREKYFKLFNEEDYKKYEARLVQQSLNGKFVYREYDAYLNKKVILAEAALQPYQEKITKLKKFRQEYSNNLQHWLFKQYRFLNYKGEQRDVIDLFEDKGISIPPSGAGDCAAPKLFQYAFKNELQPIALAEFWYGRPHASEVRKHGGFYPACRGKCEPILNFMLQGLNVASNPLLENPAKGKELEILYEDKSLLIINKPAEFLSVPGKHIQDSVEQRLRYLYPKATGPMIVHRLDMSTSGIMVIAKTKDAHQKLQKQFVERTVHKTYEAVLDGVLEKEEGHIDLPLRVDLNNRPLQLVCYEHGKRGITNWKKVAVEKDKTRVHFYPVTGRTHQLRVHAAHNLGLGMSIVGDDLYGTKNHRLCLHARQLQFKHPVTDELLEFTKPAPF